MTRRWWTVFNISIGIYMSTLDASIVNVSLPTIIQSLNTHGFITGPLIGGFFVEHLGWRSIFFVNLPIGILAILFSLKILDRTSGTGQEQDLCWRVFRMSGNSS